MTNQEMVRILKGSLDEKRVLFDYFIEKVSSGEQLADNEISIFETLKKQLIVKSIVLDVSANLHGNGGVNN